VKKADSVILMLLTKDWSIFFLSRTHILSGAIRETRQLTLTQERLFAELYAEFPALLRRALRADPTLQVPVLANDKVLTRMQMNILAAQAAADEPGFLETTEYEVRLNAELQRLMELAVYTALRKANLVPERKIEAPVRGIYSRDFVTSTHRIFAPTPATFWKAMQRAGVTYTTHLKPHNCKLHESGPIWELQLQSVQQELAAPEKNATRAEELRKQLRGLQKDIARYKQHLEQYEVCRRKVSEVERALQFNDGACVLFRDFVNLYNEQGGHVKNLVLVLITRGEDGELLVRKINNFCSDKETSGCDAFYMADVLEFHLKSKADGGSGMFDDITFITQSGDHGPHFACNSTVYNETRVFTKYGKRLHNLSLCSYHAYNRSQNT